jgi:hypothetical protein
VREKPKVDSPYREHLISMDREEQSSFGYIPLSISTKLNQKREAEVQSKQEKPLQESLDEDRFKDRSSTRRANYNYSGIDSIAQSS